MTKFSSGSKLRSRRSATVHQAGYTLVELILVLALIIVTASLAFPYLESMSEDARLVEAAELVRSRWADTRVAAMTEGRSYCFEVVLKEGDFRIVPLGLDTETGSAPAANATDGSPAPSAPDRLPNGIHFESQEKTSNPGSNQAVAPASTSSSSRWMNTITFLPDGTAREDVTLVLHGKGDRTVQLKLRALTGAVAVKVLESPP